MKIPKDKKRHAGAKKNNAQHKIAKRTMAGQSRTRKERSAEQLLARSSHPIPITSGPIVTKGAKPIKPKENDFGSLDVLEQLKQQMKAKTKSTSTSTTTSPTSSSTPTKSKRAESHADDIASIFAQKQQQQQEQIQQRLKAKREEEEQKQQQKQQKKRASEPQPMDELKFNTLAQNNPFFEFDQDVPSYNNNTKFQSSAESNPFADSSDIAEPLPTNKLRSKLTAPRLDSTQVDAIKMKQKHLMSSHNNIATPQFPSAATPLASGFDTDAAADSLFNMLNTNNNTHTNTQTKTAQATSIFARNNNNNEDMGFDTDPTAPPQHTIKPLKAHPRAQPHGKIQTLDDYDLSDQSSAEQQSDDQYTSEIDEDEYQRVLVERAQDDAEFAQELEEYYKAHPEHRVIAAKQRSKSNLPTLNLHDKPTKKQNKKGQETSSEEYSDSQEFDDENEDFSGLAAALGADSSLFAPPGATEDSEDNNTNNKNKNKKRRKNKSQTDDGSDDNDDDESYNEEQTSEPEYDENGLSNYITVKGIRIPLRGISKEQAEELLREDAQAEKEDSEGEREYAQSLGFTPEELDADKPKRITYYKLPTSCQIPLLDTNKLDFSAYQQPSVLKFDADWPEHTSICDLSLRACIVGTPNAGKSVIVNNVTRSRVTAVSAKRNTTRRRVLGVTTQGNAQLTLYDTPGINEIHDAKRYQRELATEAWDAVADADVAMVVLDAAKRIGGPELFLLHKCSETKLNNPNLKFILVLNKVDIVEPKDRLLDMLYRVQTLMPFDDCFMVSGLDGDGMADLEHYLYSNAVPREWEHSSETKTDQSDIQLAQELIRETLFHRLNQEIPYSIQQELVEWQPLQNGQLRIDTRLIVRRDMHKRILIGANGNALNAITKAAQQRLQIAFRRPVYLHLRVSVSVTQDFESANMV